MFPLLSHSQTYSPNHYTPFPADLHSLSIQITAACGFPGFVAEAGILNYYRSDSSLGIHVDESELDHSRPLLSLRYLWSCNMVIALLTTEKYSTPSQYIIFLFFDSFGQSAVFLLGGPCRQDPPTAMYMHSGDVMVMSGQSRLLYHAVPRIVPALQGYPALYTEGRGLDSTLQDGTVVEPVSEEDWAVCSRYIQSSRLNVTVRQVLGPGQSFPETPSTHLRTDADQTVEHGTKDGQSGKRKRSKSCDPVDTVQTWDRPHAGAHT